MRTFLILTISIVFASAVYAQTDPCPCYKFPYRFCTPNGVVTWCTDNPYGPDVPPGAIAPEKAPSLRGCIIMGNEFDIGLVNNGYGIVPGITPKVDSTTLSQSIGDLFTPNYANGPNQIEYMWSSFLGECNFPNQNLDMSCCLQVTFENDPTWWYNSWLGPSLQNGSQQLINIYGMVDPPLDAVCQTRCNENGADTAHMIFVNVTPIFLTDHSDPSYVPTKLTRGFVNSVGIPLTPGQPYYGQVGPYIYDTINDSTIAVIPDSIEIEQPVDFVTMVMHEMGHWCGLPERFEKCANVPGNGTCNDDPNSIMWHLNPGQRKWDPSKGPDSSGNGTGDCCWIEKLYFPGSVGPCSTDGVESSPELELNLEQSQPNPTLGIAEIGFSLNKRDFVIMDLYDILGKKMQNIVSEQMMDAGHHTVTINTQNLGSGKYIYVLQAEGKVLSKEMTVIK